MFGAGGGGAQRVSEPEKTDVRSARARTRVKNPLVLSIMLTNEDVL